MPQPTTTDLTSESNFGVMRLGLASQASLARIRLGLGLRLGVGEPGI